MEKAQWFGYGGFPVASIARLAWVGLYPHTASAIVLLSYCGPSKHISIVSGLKVQHFSEILIVKYDYVEIYLTNLDYLNKILRNMIPFHICIMARSTSGKQPVISESYTVMLSSQ